MMVEGGKVYKIFRNKNGLFLKSADINENNEVDEDSIEIEKLQLENWFDNGYVIVKTRNGRLFDFKADSSFMGRLATAREVKSDGSYITSRKVNKANGGKEMVYTYVPGKKAKEVEPGSQVPISEETFDNINFNIDYPQYELDVKYDFYSKEMELIEEKDLKIEDPTLDTLVDMKKDNGLTDETRAHIYKSRDGQSGFLKREGDKHKVSVEPVFSNYDKMSRREKVNGKGYGIWKSTESDELFFEHMGGNATSIRSFEDLQTGGALCSFMDGEGKVQWFYVSRTGETIQVPNEETYAKIRKINNHCWSAMFRIRDTQTKDCNKAVDLAVVDDLNAFNRSQKNKNIASSLEF